MNKIIWDNGLYHYIKEHNVKPSNDFINFIDNNQFLDNKKIIGKIKSKSYYKGNKTLVKLEKNQILAFDALMNYGGKKNMNIMVSISIKNIPDY